MATIAVAGLAAAFPATGAATAGAAFAAGVGYAALGLGAAYFDSKFVYPSLFGDDQSRPEKAQQLQQVRAREGAAIPIIYGRYNRVPGSIAWLGRVNEQQSAVSAGGGKGGGSQTVYVKQYLQDGLVVFCQGRVAGWRRFFANSEVIYDSDLASLIVGGSSYSWPTGSIANGKILDVIQRNGTYYQRWAWVIRTSDPQQQSQLRRLVPGARFTMSGISGGNFGAAFSGNAFAVINWAQEFEVSRVEGADLEFFSPNPGDPIHGGFLGRIVNPQNIVVSPSFRINFTGPLFDPNKIQSIFFAAGGGLNDPPGSTSPIRNRAWAPMVAEEGADKVPDYAGLGWVGFGQLNRNEFLNTFPVTLEAHVQGPAGVGGSYYPGDTIARILAEEARLPSSTFDVTRVEQTTLEGYAVQGPQTAIQAVQPLLGAFDILTQQDGEATKFISRRNVEIIDIPEDHIESFDEGGAGSLTKASRQGVSKPPSSISVDFIDVDRDMESGSTKINWHIGRSGDGENPIQVSFPVAMRKTDARRIGWRLLRSARTAQQRFFVSLPPLYDYLGENDAIRFTYAGQERLILIQRVDQQITNGLIRIEGIEDDPTAEDIVPEEYTPVRRLGNDGGPMRLPTVALSMVRSLPPLRDGDHMSGGVYAGFYSPDHRARFLGAIVYESADVSPRSYTQKATRDTRDICGITQTALPTANAGMLGVWDLSSTVDVELFGGELESRGLDITAHGYEYAVVGNEIIRFAQADLIAENTYRLSKLIRGLRDTADAALSAHLDNEAFLLFSKSSGVFIPEKSPRAMRHWKVVSPGGDISRSIEQTIPDQVGTLRPFSVGHLAATGSAGSNIEVSWSPRTNRIKPLFVSVEDELASWVYGVRVEHATIDQDPFLDVQVTGTSYSLTTAIQGGAEIDPGTPLLISVRRLGKFANSKWQSVQV